MNNYLSFISDEDLFKAVDDLYTVYIKTKQNMSEIDFYKNQIDPIKLLFDTEFNNRTIEQTIEFEINRKNDKTISNAIGKFHEDLLGSIEGFKRYEKCGYDIKSDDNCIYIDVKNKHNTVKGSNLKDLHKDLFNYIKKSENPKARAYWAQIIAPKNKSFNEKWELDMTKNNIKSENKEIYERIYKISGDKLYELMTGNKNAFKELCEVLPRFIKDFLKIKENNEFTKDSFIKEDSKFREDEIIKRLKEESSKKGNSIIIELFNKTFNAYIGFPIIDSQNHD